MRLASKFFLPHELWFPGALLPACAWKTVAFTFVGQATTFTLRAPFAIVFNCDACAFIERRMEEQDMRHQLWLGCVSKNMKDNVHRIFALFKLYKIKLDFKG